MTQKFEVNPQGRYLLLNDILASYSDRASLNNFSYLAPESEIKTNDYNLNISRYISTVDSITNHLTLSDICYQQRKIQLEHENISNELNNLIDEYLYKNPL